MFILNANDEYLEPPLLPVRPCYYLRNCFKWNSRRRREAGTKNASNTRPRASRNASNGTCHPRKMHPILLAMATAGIQYWRRYMSLWALIISIMSIHHEYSLWAFIMSIRNEHSLLGCIMRQCVVHCIQRATNAKKGGGPFSFEG